MHYLLDGLADRIIACYHGVRQHLPQGLARSSYLNALEVDCRRAGMRPVRDRTFAVRYGGVVVGEYRADLIIDSLIVVEVRQVPRLGAADRQHLAGCLRAAGVPVGLALNFGERPDTCRVEFWPGVARVAESWPGGLGPGPAA